VQGGSRDKVEKRLGLIPDPRRLGVIMEGQWEAGYEFWFGGGSWHQERFDRLAAYVPKYTWT